MIRIAAFNTKTEVSALLMLKQVSFRQVSLNLEALAIFVT